MKILYLDLGMGAAGDMLTAALIELLPEPEKFIDELNSIGIPGVVFERETLKKCGITGTHIKVTVNGMEEESQDVHDHEHAEHAESAPDDAKSTVFPGHGGLEHHEHVHGQGGVPADHSHSHEHEYSHEHSYDHGSTHTHEHTHTYTCEYTHGFESSHTHMHDHDHTYTHDHPHGHIHSSLKDIEHIVRENLGIPDSVKDKVMSVYGLIAEAESKAHNVPVSEIHFHEVGTMDAVADITAVCMLMEKIAPERITASPVHVGSGSVRCAHGILPVPAPATAYILKDVPIYGGRISGELCTPTGAALLKTFVDSFGDMPVMKTAAIGYGMGKKDFEQANCIRAFLGETAGSTDTVAVLSCNLDDMTPEAIGFAMDVLFREGALDVYTIPAGMKKSRPGTILSVICRETDKQRMAELIFRYTTTIGIRESILRRYTLERSTAECKTPYGIVRKKISSGYGVSREKYEYEDIASIARDRNIPLDEVL